MDRELLEQRKQMLTELVHDKAYVPMKAKEIAMLLNIPKAMRGELQEVLDELVSEGKLGISKKGKYGKPETFHIYEIPYRRYKSRKVKETERLKELLVYVEKQVESCI